VAGGGDFIRSKNTRQFRRWRILWISFRTGVCDGEYRRVIVLYECFSRCNFLEARG